MGLGDIGKAMDKLDESMLAMQNMESLLEQVLVELKAINNNIRKPMPLRGEFG
jgi:hypothetical protein